MSWKCPHCGFDTGLAPLTFKDREGVATCPRCDRVLPTGATEDPVAKGLRWIEQENPGSLITLWRKWTVERPGAEPFVGSAFW